MTTQQAERHQVKVVGMGQTTGGNDFLVVEPWFKTQYPLNIYLKEGTGGNIRKGDIITVEKGSQQKNKQGQLKDPKFESSFYWNLVEPDLFTQPQSQAAGASPASQTNAPQQTSRTASSPATAQQGSVTQGAPLALAPAYIDRDMSIARQVALKEAMNYCVAYESRTKTDMDIAHFDKIFQHNLDLILGMPTRAPLPEELPS